LCILSPRAERSGNRENEEGTATAAGVQRLGQPTQDVNDGKPWSEMDLFDLRNSLAYGRSIEEVAGFLCRSGTVEEVKRKAEELGLLR
jgi:hypothetical protein